MVWAQEARCADYLPQIAKQLTNDTIRGDQDAKNLELFRKCLRRSAYCAVVQGPPNYVDSLLEGQSLDEAAMRRRRWWNAQGALGPMKSPKHGSVCAMAQYSGVSAAVWMFIAWHTDNGKVKKISAPIYMPSLNGDVLAIQIVWQWMTKSAESLR